MARHTGETPTPRAKKQTISMTITVPGIRPLLRHLSSLPKEAQAAIRDAAGEIAKTEAKRIQEAATGEGPQAVMAARSVRVKRDRVPAIVAGGTRNVSTSRRRIRASDAFFGAEFGGRGRKTTQQFQPHKGREGYFFFPTIRDDEPEMIEEWLTVVDRIESEWTQAS